MILTPVECRYCGGDVHLINNEAVYGHPYGDWPYMYQCERCGASVGTHPGTEIPLGTLANEELRNARKENKTWFVKLYKGDSPIFANRTGAYVWLALQLGIHLDECHWALFERDRCIEAGNHCKELWTKYHYD